MTGRSFARAAWMCVAVTWAAGCATRPSDPYFMKTKSQANVFVSPDHVKICKVAVLPLKAPTELIGASVSDMFVTELLRSGRYEVVERSQMANVLGEAELALAGLSSARAAEVGNMLGADGVIIGTVSEYETVAQRGRPYPVVGVSMRLIDCRSGKILWSLDLARKAENSRVTLSEHGRQVVHELAAALYQQCRAIRK